MRLIEIALDAVNDLQLNFGHLDRRDSLDFFKNLYKEQKKVHDGIARGASIFRYTMDKATVSKFSCGKPGCTQRCGLEVRRRTRSG